jgi:2-methylisocitrate lyase-like PEP mutase family enzyme
MSTQAFHAMHHADRPLLLPNAWDHASGAALAAAGFAAVGTTSLGVAATHGLSDGLARTREQTLALARMLGDLPCPVSIDIEAGFSDDPGEVAEFAARIADTGAAGINIEDGRPDGLADAGHQAELVAAIRARVPSLFVNARVDNYWLSIDMSTPRSTLDRAARYLEAGADGVFVPGAADNATIAALVDGIEAPLNVLHLPGRQTVAELTELGVRRISTGSLLFRRAVHAAVQAAEAIRDGGTLPPGIPGYDEIQRLADGGARN